MHFPDQCRVAWDEGEGTAVNTRDFTGGGALAIEVEAMRSHGIKNTGSGTAVLMSLSDFVYSPSNLDTFPRTIL